MKNSKAIDYQITKKQFDGILSTRKDDEAKKNPYQYVTGLSMRVMVCVVR